uniref:Pycsar effector protein domain-containing protein n=1 Tax=Candidatus Kentrum eta TaxID=2126337 RepID=A0A450ULQ5_9GAMM|nr:MAG: hypothetical protein BECKH772A_GA0070896_100573 [Candidatus Kentron sp. H]VFJ94297.1 MAG: hypothetical protein BECKH772B_GA0070898_100592 [Candidatus Kentron sp. H]VFK00908.1 MAG: hypothetical protein BECKH772C_GA0070978_100553 [Candidatus Kentron sp. H]
MTRSDILNGIFDKIVSWILANDKKAGFIIGLGGLALGWTSEKSEALLSVLGTTYFALIIIVMILGILCGIAAIFPVTMFRSSHSLLFFADIAKDFRASGKPLNSYSSDYLARINQNHEEALAQQIVVVSVIARAKYRLLAISFILLLIGFMASVTSIAIHSIQS